jgi:hypothetical protein
MVLLRKEIGRRVMFSEKIKEAIRFWEKRRIVYNGMLTVVAVAWVVWTWPHFRGALTFEHALALFVLALLANICYCAAYLAEISFSIPKAGQVWTKWRWGLWVLGTVFAVVLENYWIADEIYPDVH